MMDLSIREMKMEDINQILVIEEEAFTVPWSRSAFESEVSHNFLAAYLVAEAEGEILGYGGMWFILDEAHITNVAVKSGFRGRGVGMAIVKALVEKAAERKIGKLTLEVREGNSAAIRLYEKMGFVTEGRRPGYYRDNHEAALIMWKRDRKPDIL